MNISFLIPSLQGGGAEKVAIQLANEFVKKGHKVSIAVLKINQSVFKALHQEVQVYPLKAKKMSHALLAFNRYVNQVNPDVVLSFMTDANVIASLVKFIFRKKYKLFLTKHSTYTKGRQHFPNWLRKIDSFLIPFLYKRSDKVICVSQGVADDFIDYFNFPRTKVEVIFNPLPVQEIKQKASLQLLPEQLRNTVNDKPLILAIGRFTPAKNFSLLINAFSKIQKHIPAQLLILGEGDLRESLSQQIKSLSLDDKMYLPGFIDNPYPWMKKAHLFVLSSDYEGFALVLAEALICGTPIVSTDCKSGPAEILDNGKFGRLVPCNDVDALAQAMLDQLDHPMSVDATAKIQSFDTPYIAQQYLTLFES